MRGLHGGGITVGEFASYSTPLLRNTRQGSQKQADRDGRVRFLQRPCDARLVEIKLGTPTQRSWRSSFGNYVWDNMMPNLELEERINLACWLQRPGPSRGCWATNGSELHLCCRNGC